jgi:hypothetical protein
MPLSVNDTPAQYSFRKLRWNPTMTLRTSLITCRPVLLKKTRIEKQKVSIPLTVKTIPRIVSNYSPYILSALIT